MEPTVVARMARSTVVMEAPHKGHIVLLRRGRSYQSRVWRFMTEGHIALYAEGVLIKAQGSLGFASVPWVGRHIITNPLVVAAIPINRDRGNDEREKVGWNQ